MCDQPIVDAGMAVWLVFAGEPLSLIQANQLTQSLSEASDTY
jgi:hypothetical protein